MAEPLYGQQAPMEDASMEGTLEAQIRLVWPAERLLLERLGLPSAGRVLDLGCGTGRAAGRIAAAWPGLEVVGLDLFEGHLAAARRDFPPERLPNLRFLAGDARATGLPASSFGAVVIRHMLHALPEPDRVLAEARRLLVAGGLLYELAEDYQGLIIDTPDAAARDLFLEVADPMLGVGTNLRHGRGAFGRLRRLGLRDVRVDPIVVDTCSGDREDWAAMFRCWRDGYAAFKARLLGVAPVEVERRYAHILRAVADPDAWVGWWLIAASGRAP